MISPMKFSHILNKIKQGSMVVPILLQLFVHLWHNTDNRHIQ